MIATPVAPAAEPGSITLELKALDARLLKLRRLAEIKRTRRELLDEQDRIEQELFGSLLVGSTCGGSVVKPLTASVAAIGRQPTEDERRGMAWWNELSDTARVYWLDQASVGRRLWDISAADAWAAFKESESR
jgi:hypothetical protein